MTDRLRDRDLIRQDAEGAIATCGRAWDKAERAHVTMGAGFLHMVASDVLTLLGEVERLERIEEERERLRFDLSRLHRAWDDLDAYREVTAALFAGDLSVEEAKEALAAERAVLGAQPTDKETQ